MGERKSSEFETPRFLIRSDEQLIETGKKINLEVLIKYFSIEILFSKKRISVIFFKNLEFLLNI